ncbi:deoxyhypusine hydroxylase-like [Stegodyphus dumicola]|uniref:deoxyhypusine hydroxylase-like n=1 Tax=Stegodyphus dumicola TaxID=202533 RepID=UPI0015AC9029|nr:deoxyhypusine hydroxylase-like [Stegodyphus dumicola]
MELSKENKLLVESIGRILIDVKRPMKERFRALFTLRNIGGELSIKCIEKCFEDSSALLKHECAYCLGQMRDALAVPKLESILNDAEEEVIVRHEAAEALAAIGLKSSCSVLRKHLNDPSREVSETCQIALEKLQDKEIYNDDLSQNPYKSIDPTPPLPKSIYNSVNELESILLDESQTLYKRYQAMFSLRNMGTDDSALALAKGLTCGSPLFRHEIAYVLGQMQNKSTVKQLAEVLFNENEHEMVRHECAEALGAIATEECMEILNRYVKDEKRVVRESCEVALDMCDYENGKEFQYADALLKISA